MSEILKSQAGWGFLAVSIRAQKGHGTVWKAALIQWEAEEVRLGDWASRTKVLLITREGFIHAWALASKYSQRIWDLCEVIVIRFGPTDLCS